MEEAFQHGALTLAHEGDPEVGGVQENRACEGDAGLAGLGVAGDGAGGLFAQEALLIREDGGRVAVFADA